VVVQLAASAVRELLGFIHGGFPANGSRTGSPMLLRPKKDCTLERPTAGAMISVKEKVQRLRQYDDTRGNSSRGE